MQPMHGPSTQRLLRADLRLPIEQCVSTYLGRHWQVTDSTDRTDEASHPAAVLSDGDFAVFVKLGEGDRAADQATQELAGLRLLTKHAGVRTPTGIGVVPVAAGALLILAAVPVIPRQPSHWWQMGQILAQIHGVKGEHFGLATHSYWGSFYQDNRPLADWPEFFWTRRIEPRLRAAVNAGHLPPAFVTRIETLGRRLTDLCGPPVAPTLLHGDAHQNNILSTMAGPVFVDPAVYYGHPEVDLASVDIFMPVEAELWHGYQTVQPIDPGFWGRRDLWRIPFRLAMVELDGPQHLEALDAALRLYV